MRGRGWFFSPALAWVAGLGRNDSLLSSLSLRDIGISSPLDAMIPDEGGKVSGERSEKGVKSQK